MYRIAKHLRPSLEAIQYQGKSGLFAELKLVYQELMDEPNKSKDAYEKCNLAVENIIKRYTGLTVDFKIDPSAGYYNAWAMFPLLDINNPLLVFWRDAIGFEKLRITLPQVKKVSDTLRGELDLEKGRVSGVFAKLVSKIRISPDFFRDTKFTAGEIAAVTTHEIGHCFTYFEKLLSTVSINMAIATAAAELQKTQDPKIRMELVFETAKVLNAKLDDPESLAKEKSSDVFQAVMLKATIDSHLHSAGGASTYDLRSCEFLADQFAVRQGAARDLATGLDKMMRTFGATPRSTSAYVSIEVSRFVLTLFGMLAFFGLFWTMILGAVVTLMSLTIGDFEAKIYDDPNERMSRMKHDLIQTLKDTRLDPALRQQILADLEIIDGVKEEWKDRRSLLNYLWIACTSKRREQFKQFRFQQELEKLINNDLFVKADKLETLAQ